MQILSPSWSTLWLFHIPYLLTPSLMVVPFLPPSTLTPPRPHYSLEFPVSWGLGASSLTESRPGSPLLHLCWGPHISLCMLPGWWLSAWEIPGLQVNWDCWSSCRVTLLFSIFQVFANSTSGVTSLCTLVGCKDLYLTHSAAFLGLSEGSLDRPLFVSTP